MFVNQSAMNNPVATMCSAESMRHNAIVMNYSRSSLAAIAGSVAGILGLEGWVHGILFYLLVSSLLSFCILIFQTRFKPQLYFISGLADGQPSFLAATWTVFTDQVFGNLFSYMLFWTLAYGLVHIYD